MTEDTTIAPLRQPGTILDPLTEIAREGARQILAAALKAGAASFVTQFAEERLPDGRQRAVRCFMGHAVMENRSGPVVQGGLTRADGRAERRAALSMIHDHSPGSTRWLTVAADKGSDSADFVRDFRQACVPPHVTRTSPGRPAIRPSTDAPPPGTRAARCPGRAGSASKSRSAGPGPSAEWLGPCTEASNASGPASS